MTRRIILAALLCLLSGCLSKVTILDRPDAGSIPSLPGPPGGGQGSSGPSLGDVCVRGGYCAAVARPVGTLDLLFVIDNSTTMQDEQAALVAQFPKLVNALSTGKRDPNDPQPFVPVSDLHVGVASSDLGLAGVDEIAGCAADGGDNGRLQNTPHGDACDAMYPPFLSSNSDRRSGPVTDPVKFSNDLACVARLGTQGCGFVQPLEAGLKALWPSVYHEPNGQVSTNPVEFLATSADGRHGLGDIPIAEGGNLGFLHSDDGFGPGLFAMIVVTDQDDCSMRGTDGFRAQGVSAAPDASAQSDGNLRCFYNKAALFDVVNRYGKALPKLREGYEDRVMFGAIVGVPTDLVDAYTRANVDFSDLQQRDAFYSAILNDRRMEEAIDPSTDPGTGTGALRPSCIRPAPDQSGRLDIAYPPRRIVELAQTFGENGVVQSICQDDMAPALDPIIDMIGRHVGADCLPAPLRRSDDGKVSCDVIFELPPPGQYADDVPVECESKPYLSHVSGSRKRTNARGGQNCVVRQLAKPGPDEEGWFYDDSSDSLGSTCRHGQLQRVGFNLRALPSGVDVVIDCAPGSLQQ